MMKVCSVIGLIQNYLNGHSSSGSQSTLFPHKLLHKHRFFIYFGTYDHPYTQNACMLKLNCGGKTKSILCFCFLLFNSSST